MTGTICEYLQARVKDYRAEKRESIRWVARQSGVDYTTIYRLGSGEQKKLSFVNAKKILLLIEPKNAENVLADYYPRETSELGTAQDVDELVTLLADDLQLYKVFAFAEMGTVERHDVKDEFGRQGLLLLDMLIESGILLESAKTFKSILDGRAYPPEEVIKKIAIHHYHMVSLSASGSIIEVMREGLNDEGVRELHKAVEELREKALKIAAENKGNRLTVLSAIAGPGSMK